VYRIILDTKGKPIRYEMRPLADGSSWLSDFPSTPNLATLSRAAATLTPERVVRGETSRGTRYVLMMTAAIVPPPQRCRTSITTRNVEMDGAGKELRGRTIFQGQGTRECREYRHAA
jgi:hypothetical protein